MASTDRPTANATATRPADGAEKSAAPHTAVTSANVPINSAPSSLPICLPPPVQLLPKSLSSHVSTSAQEGQPAASPLRPAAILIHNGDAGHVTDSAMNSRR